LGGTAICEAKRIWSRLLLLRLWERLPDLMPPVRLGAGTLQPIDATMPFDSYVLSRTYSLRA
jgi:hypothetical protein